LVGQKKNLVFKATVLKTFGRVGSIFLFFFLLRIETLIIKTPTKKTKGIFVKKVSLGSAGSDRYGLVARNTGFFFGPLSWRILYWHCLISEVNLWHIRQGRTSQWLSLDWKYLAFICMRGWFIENTWIDIILSYFEIKITQTRVWQPMAFLWAVFGPSRFDTSRITWSHG